MAQSIPGVAEVLKLIHEREVREEIMAEGKTKKVDAEATVVEEPTQETFNSVRNKMLNTAGRLLDDGVFKADGGIRADAPANTSAAKGLVLAAADLGVALKNKRKS